MMIRNRVKVVQGLGDDHLKGREVLILIFEADCSRDSNESHFPHPCSLLERLGLGLDHLII